MAFRRWPVRQRAALVLAVGSALGLSVEWYQGGVPGRSLSPMDVGLNLTGVLLVALICSGVGRRSQDDTTMCGNVSRSMKAKDAIEFHSRCVHGFAAKYQKAPDFRERYSVWTKLIEKYSSPAASVLDVGCGVGMFSFAAAKFNKMVVGIDASPEMIEFCKQKQAELKVLNVRFGCNRLEDLPGAGLAKADLLLCSSVLDYVDDLPHCLNVVVNLLNKGGHLIVSLPNKSAIYRKVEQLTFRLTGRPSYFAHIKNVATLGELTRQLAPRGAALVEAHFYAKLGMSFGVLGRLADAPVLNSLFVAVYRVR
ncbi:MAG: class I SAM-dependent methyltransferase [Candidatus Rokubacteria bacterium]|nr:class I SAM-dependent methyltransferase [Candidatus Rokubacteria bacterium]